MFDRNDSMPFFCAQITEKGALERTGVSELSVMMHIELYSRFRKEF